MILLILLVCSGCVSEKKAREQAHRAYQQGQEEATQAAMRAQRQQQGPVIFVQGPVRNPQIPWQEGMKLSEAVVAAEYTSFMNPRIVRVIRNGAVAGEFKGIDLLHHQDMELEDGDTVLIVP